MLKDVVYSVDVQAIEKEDRRRWSNAMAEEKDSCSRSLKLI